MIFRFLIPFVFIPVTFSLEESINSPQEAKDRDDFVKALNDVRRYMAKQKKVPYMHELIYDENMFKQFDNKIGIPSFSIPDYKTMTKELEAYQNIFFNASDMSFHLLLALSIGTHAFQKKIKCLKSEPEIECYMGPLKMHFITYIDTSPPGTLCDDGYYNNDGLCCLIPTTTAKTSKPSEDEEEEWECSPSSHHKVDLACLIFLFLLLFLLV